MNSIVSVELKQQQSGCGSLPVTSERDAKGGEDDGTGGGCQQRISISICF